MAIYSIYISYFNMNGALATVERKLYDIPVSPSEPNLLVEPRVKCEMGKAGTFEFSVYYGHPYYNCWNLLMTMLRVEYYGETIFYGRVLTVDTDHLTSKKTIHCEGYLAFLLDSIIEGEADEKRPRTDCSTYISSLLANHNNQMVGDYPPKRFLRGLMPGSYGSTNIVQQLKTDSNTKYGSSGWQDTASAFNSLTGAYGGYLRTRYVNGAVYLDWLDAFFNDRVGDRVIEVTNNALTLSSSEDVENIFTIVLPIGKNTSNDDQTDSVVYLGSKYIRVPDIVNHFSTSELEAGYHSVEDYTNAITKYGSIYRTVEFPNADTVAKLTEYAWDWIKNNYHGGYSTFTASAIDLKITGDKTNYLLVGDRCTVIYPDGAGGNVRRILTITKAEYDLHKPDGNSYTIGVPLNDLNKTYGEPITKQTEQKEEKIQQTPTPSGGNGGSVSTPKYNSTAARVQQLEDKVDHFFELYTLRQSETNAEYQAYKQKYGEDQAEQRVLRSTALLLDKAIDEEGTPKDVKEAKRRVSSMLFDANNGTMTGYKLAPWLENSAMSSYANEILSDTYTGQASMVLDVYKGDLTFNEQIDWLYDDLMTQYRQGNRPLYLEKAKAVFGVKIAQNETDAKKDQYSEITLSHTERRRSDKEVTASENSVKMESDIGRILSPYIQVPSGMGTILDTLASTDPKLSSLKGALNLLGPEAKFSTTNLTNNTKETTAIEGNGTSGEGLVKAGWNGTDYRTWLNKEVSYLDANDRRQVSKGFVVGDDIKTGSYDSLNVRLLIVSNLIAERATIAQLNAATARITSLEANKADIADLNVTNQLLATKASIDDLNATNAVVSGKADIADLNATNAVVSGKADIADLNAVAATVSNLSANAITTSNLSSSLSNLSTIFSNNISNSGWMSTDRIMVNSRWADWQHATVLTDAWIQDGVVYYNTQGIYYLGY